VKIEHVLGANSAAVENLQKMVGEMVSGRKIVRGGTDEMEIDSTPPRGISNSIDKPRALDQQQHFNRIDWSNRPGNTPRNSRRSSLWVEWAKGNAVASERPPTVLPSPRAQGPIATGAQGPKSVAPNHGPYSPRAQGPLSSRQASLVPNL
jgi:hypothetical protein